MAKALVIKGANFSENRLTVVTLGDSVPCTGITLDQATKAVTSMTPFTLAATPAPADTSDVVSWGSSDASIAAVSNGVVTPLSLGEVTITAACGAYSASCAVTIDNVSPDFIVVPGYNPNRRTSSGNATTVGKVNTAATSGLAILAADQSSGLYPIESKTDADTSPYRFVPIIIPAGAAKIIIGRTGTAAVEKFKTRTYFFDSSREETTFGTGGAYCAAGVMDTWDQSSTAAGPLEIAVPANVDGLDSFCCAFALSPSQTAFIDITSQFTVAFSYDKAT